MRRLALVAVVATVLLAGCGGIADDGPDRDPYGVDDSVDPTDGDVLPGSSEDELENERELVRAHTETIEGESYSLQSTTTIGDGSESLVIEQRARIDSDARHVIERRDGSWPTDESPRFDHGGDRLERWYEGDVAVERLEHENGTVEYGDRFTWGSWIGGMRAEAILRSIGEWTVETRHLEGDRYYVIEGTEPADRSEFLADEPYDATVYVRNDGLIRHAERSGTIRDGGDELLVEETVTVDDVGDTDVERPDWVATAVAELEDERPGSGS